MNRPQHTVIVADDDPDQLRALQFHLEKSGYAVSCASNRTELFEALQDTSAEVLIQDLQFGSDDGLKLLPLILQHKPSLSVIMLTAYGSIDSAVTAMKQGAFDYVTKPPDFNHLRLLVDQAVEHQTRTGSVNASENTRQAIYLAGPSRAMVQLHQLIDSIAPTSASALIFGESGTGKEQVAREIHNKSPHRDGPLVVVNMASFPRDRAETTLFGQEWGLSSGVGQSQVGCCEAADGGTLLLDQIGEMDIGLQSKLLQFLQDQTVRRIGSSQMVQVDVRILATTNRDPLQAMRDGLLREDLYYRLNVIPITLPPLRDRLEDLPELARLFLDRYADCHQRPAKQFGEQALTLLQNFDWPGNVRQLENLVERLVILSDKEILNPDALPPEIASQEAISGREISGLKTLDALEKQAIIDALEASQGVVSQAAAILGIGQATVYRKIKRYGISVPGRSQFP